MVALSMKLTLLAASLSSAASVATLSPMAVCQSLAKQISGMSDVLYPADVLTALNFTNDISHWFSTSTQIPTCVLQAGSAEDVSKAMKLVAANRTPFAVRSGGHTSNPGFSSTTGLHIVFTKMEQVDLSPDKSTVEIGMGQDWATVYDILASSGVNVVGGRVPGPGCGGFTLGGGFSWKTNQYGLTADSVKQFNMVLPNGTITSIDSSQSDLFFALKGGLNRFGVLTSAVYYTHPQPPQIYGGVAIYSDALAAVNATRAFFDINKDPKAQIITTIEGGPTGATALALFFYDGPTRPSSFSPFDSLTPLFTDVKTQTFSSFVNGVPSHIDHNIRGVFDTISTSKLTQTFVDAVVNETNFYSKYMLTHGAQFVSYDIEPFLTSYGEHATEAAYPHSDSPLPLNIYYSWALEADDAFWFAAVAASKAHLRQVAISEGILPADFTAYPNYAVSNTSATALYGQRNAARLASIKKQVDPSSIMELAGGFTI